MDEQSQSLTVSVPEAGKMLSISRSLSFRLCKQGTIPCIKLGKRLRVPRAALMRMLEEAGRTEEETR